MSETLTDDQVMAGYVNPLKYLSICSGICSATVAWQPLGWSPVAFSEIEPFPSAVLAHRHPGVPNLGDMTLFLEWPEELLAEIDLIVGGTPCQAFSVAGLRASLSDDRGNLTLVYVALVNHIDTIRARYGRPPVICVWENVPGVLSTKDNAFGCFLGGMAGSGLPLLAPGGAWEYAGYVRGPLRAIAWRSLDAQYFGVPQRRHRVFAVASARDGFRPEEILFESEGLRRDSPPCREAWEATTGTLTSRAGNSSRQAGGESNIVSTIDASFGRLQGCSGQDLNHGHSHLVAASVTSKWAKGSGGPSGDECQNLLAVTPPLTSNPYGDHESREGLLVTHALTAEGHDASEDGTGRGTPIIPVPFGVDESPDVAHCLSSGASKADKHESTTYIAEPLAFDCKASGQNGFGIGGVSPTLRSMGHADSHQNGGGHAAVCFAENSRHELRLENGDGSTVGTLSTGGGKPGQGTPAIVINYAVRRLTPRECERLQGFPDDFTQIPGWNGWRDVEAEESVEDLQALNLTIKITKKGKARVNDPDGPRYKALGNSMAVPCMIWIGQRIASWLKTLTSDPCNPN